MPTEWESRRDFMWAAIYHHGCSLTDLSRYFDVTRERIRQVVARFGWPYSTDKAFELWCPWPRPSRCTIYGKWSKNYDACIDCGSTRLRHLAKGRCVSCHSNYLYHTDPERHRKQLEATTRWMKNNPERTKAIQSRAAVAYRQRHRALGLCLHCPTPAVPNRSMCQTHLDYRAAKGRERYAALKGQR